MPKLWKTIKEGQIQVVYQCINPYCHCDKKEAWVEPAWHQENGTPVCEGDRDMSYMRTVIQDFGHDKVSDVFATVEVEEE